MSKMKDEFFKEQERKELQGIPEDIDYELSLKEPTEETK
jgi:hypothetical protein